MHSVFSLLSTMKRVNRKMRDESEGQNQCLLTFKEEKVKGLENGLPKGKQKP